MDAKQEVKEKFLSLMNIKREKFFRRQRSYVKMFDTFFIIKYQYTNYIELIRIKKVHNRKTVASKTNKKIATEDFL